MQIRPLSTQEVIDHKPHLLKLILKSLEAHPPVIEDPEDTVQQAINGEIQIWGFIEDEIIGIFCMGLIKNAITIFGFSGRGILKHVQEGLGIVEALARQARIPYIQIYATPAVAKKVIKRPYEELAVVTIRV